MRSLTVLNRRRVLLANADDVFVHTAVDTAGGVVYAATRSGDVVAAGEDQGRSWQRRIPILRERSDDAIVAMQFLPDQNMLCVACRLGELVLLQASSNTENIEIVGIVDDGILAMGWSPDYELVVFITGRGNVVTMTREFNPLGETPLRVDAQGDAVPVSVGWGKKETQFHGRAGKQAALEQSVLPEQLISNDDDGSPRVSWRGDGQLFVVSSVDEGDKPRRILRVYSRESVLQSTSELVPLLEQSLSWRPAGNLIASSQRLPQRHDIVFFERNGLRHGEFTLPAPPTSTVVEVSFNCDSSVLLVLLGNVDGSHSVQLWTQSNYHWYLKQEFNYDARNSVPSVTWDPETALRLYVASQSSVHVINMVAEVLANTSLATANPCSVAVIDGVSLLLTPLSLRNVPPPMAAFTLHLPANIRHISFGPADDVNSMAVLLATNQIALFKGPSAAEARPPILQKIFKLVGLNVEALQIAYISTSLLLVLNSGDTSAQLALININESSDDEIIPCDEITLPWPLLRMHWSVTFSKLLLENSSGSLFTIPIDIEHQSLGDVIAWHFAEDEYDDMTLAEPAHLPATASYITLAPFDDEQGHVPVVVSMGERGRLLLNDRVVLNNATSFFVHSDYIIITTSSHTARFISLHQPWQSAELKEATGSSLDETCRAIERGGRIVAAVANGIALILQMPRGNLETIYPRALVLSAIRSALNRLDYAGAFSLCRVHRIDMNLIHDHDPQSFSNNVEFFIQQLDDVEKLNLFISSLRDDDVVSSLYATDNRLKFAKPKRTGTSKVTLICDLVRPALEKPEYNGKFFKAVLTAHVCRFPPDLEAALKAIQSINGTHDDVVGALEYLAFLTDMTQLYDAALGLYDLDLVLVIAQQSQKDPRDYLPFLSKLQSMAPSYQRFTIDDLLKRHHKAIVHLFQAGTNHFDEFLAYMNKHSLFQTALELVRSEPSSEKYNRVLEAFAVHLRSQKLFVDAGHAFSRISNFAMAADCFVEGRAWRELFGIISTTEGDSHSLVMKPSEMTSLARRMAALLRQDSRHDEAAIVLQTYANDVEEAVEALCSGGMWTEASRLCVKEGRRDLEQTHIQPAVVEAFEKEHDLFVDLLAKAKKSLERLVIVRIEKQEKARLRVERGLPAEDDINDDDNRTETASMQSGSTRQSGSSRTSRKTSKTRRKEERKKMSGREGSAHEEEYLMHALATIINAVNKQIKSIGQLLRALFRLGFDEKASLLQTVTAAAVDFLSSNHTSMLSASVAPVQPVDGQETQAVVELPTIPLVNQDPSWRLPLFSA